MRLHQTASVVLGTLALSFACVGVPAVHADEIQQPPLVQPVPPKIEIANGRPFPFALVQEQKGDAVPVFSSEARVNEGLRTAPANAFSVAAMQAMQVLEILGTTKFGMVINKGCATGALTIWPDLMRDLVSGKALKATEMGKVERERNFLRFANFVCFFPQLLAGPIERAGHMLPQFAQFPAFRLQNLTDGLSLFLVGLFKKIALASYLSLYVDRVYDNPQAASAPALILGTVAFGWQLFFDFSGYADMARGVARIMGFDLVLNFNHPYLADSVADFWRRWHISFSKWILDYIFMPLQMQWREWPRLGTAAALLVTFLVSGIWHGAAWTFIIWGLLHGFGLVVTRELERSRFYRKKVPKLLKQACVFIFVSFAWIFFRADSLGDALMIVRRIFCAAWRDPQMPALMLLLVALVWLYQVMCESRLRVVLQSGFVRVGAAVGMMLYLWLCAAGGGAFIYFQF